MLLQRRKTLGEKETYRRICFYRRYRSLIREQISEDVLENEFPFSPPIFFLPGGFQNAIYHLPFFLFFFGKESPTSSDCIFFKYFRLAFKHNPNSAFDITWNGRSFANRGSSSQVLMRGWSDGAREFNSVFFFAYIYTYNFWVFRLGERLMDTLQAMCFWQQGIQKLARKCRSVRTTFSSSWSG